MVHLSEANIKQTYTVFLGKLKGIRSWLKDVNDEGTPTLRTYTLSDFL
jgi:hypothetical protein